MGENDVINAGEWVYKHAVRKPGVTAVVVDDRRLSYAELNARVNRLAHSLVAMNISRRDRVAALMFNSNEYMELSLALAKIGAVLVPLNYRLAPPELAHILNDSSARVLVYSHELSYLCEAFLDSVELERYICVGGEPTHPVENYEALLARASDSEPRIVPTGADDDLVILYTSGTTGKPKGTVLTHGNVLFASLNVIHHAGNSEGSVLIAVPMFHVAGLTAQALPTIYRGQTIVFQRYFDPEHALQLIEREKIRASLLVPAMLLFMSQVSDFHRYDLSSIDSVFIGGAPCPAPILRTYLDRNVSIRQGFGMTENCGTGIVLDPEDLERKFGSCGKPMFHCNARVWNEKCEDTHPNEVGELMLQGPVVTKGYWNMPEQTKASFTDGWFHTGDLAKTDEDGYFYIVERKKDMLITGGENVYPAEVEEVILAHPKVAEVGVIGIPDAKWGESVRAVVAPLSGQALTAEEIQDFCKGKLAKYKIPKSVIFIEELPRNPAGKILKRVLREQYGKS
ncbi:MAG: long-chain-fatty-acid--CoA ligase [Candidatus Abyssobacteria bacterium SURF_17]|uniref:Long-chain-fatty-acid--CoA ligase n=1 Tax=Candidatus Abyssobacteria bacterium SURF_17 TaxID=2093361 RepID=A0A419ESR9_9BACT|nr:MAG: long-chain-fatty-acid--CoA ligase [Candidatus Abyssubacteria bacterium SURF_17]